MRKTVFAVLSAWSLVCAAQQPAKAPRVRDVAEGVYECNLDDTSKMRSCDNIPVIVLMVGSKCRVLLPYYELKVHSKNRGNVTWVLNAPPGYSFASNGINITTDPSGQPPVESVWLGGKPIGQTAYQWTKILNATPNNFGHAAVVLDPSQIPCKASDPVISNDNN